MCSVKGVILMDDKNKKYEVTLGNLYELNKQAMVTHPIMKNSKIEKIKPDLEEWFNWKIDGYVMLLCRERYDFTVFHLYAKENPNPPKIATAELIELLKERGKILSIEKDSNTINNAWEIWLKIGEEAFVYYLFGCDDWVIEC
jgi:hypothetical protein